MIFDNVLIRVLALGLPALLIVAAVFRWLHQRRTQVSFRQLRGRSLRTIQQVQDALDAVPSGHTLRLGMQLMPHRVAYGHFAIVGATGSGKTLLQRLLLQSALPRIGSGLDQRALICDAKQDVFSLLAGMGLRCPVVTFHPFDTQCVAWDMAADINSPAAALQAAALLVPKAQHDANPFFSNAARHLMYAALMTQAPGRWTLRHSAVAAGVAYLQSAGGVSRRGEDGRIHETARLVFAAFLHSTSRAQDPQLHVRTVLLNVGVRADGTTGTLEPKGLYRHQMAAGALFRAELAARLERELGLRYTSDIQVCARTSFEPASTPKIRTASV